MSKAALIARIHSHNGNYGSFDSNLIKLGFSFSFITKESSENVPVFLHESDLPKSKRGLEMAMFESITSHDEANDENGGLSTLNIHRWKMNDREPTLEDAELYCKAARALRNKISKMNEDANSDVERFIQILKASGAKGLWAQNTARSQGDAEFKLYPIEDFERLLQLEMEFARN